jgi:hypothetical protein
MLARSTAAFTATAPSLVALIPLSAPWNFPIGVRTALKMTASFSLLIDSPLAISGNYKANGFVHWLY